MTELRTALSLLTLITEGVLKRVVSITKRRNAYRSGQTTITLGLRRNPPLV